MDLSIVLLVSSVVAVLLFVLGSPIILVIGAWVSLVAVLAGDVGLIGNIGQTTYFGIASFALLAMPLFILTGDVLLESGVARSVTRFSRASLGYLRGATALTTIGASGIFAAISGSSSATAATVGSLMHKEMREEGYDAPFAAATCAAGGTVGIMIPPSLMFIVYGILLSIPVGTLFIAGILPGVAMIVAMMLVAHVRARRNRWGTVGSFSLLGAAKSMLAARHAFLAIVLALGGIYLGVFSPTEAAAIAAAYLVVAALVERTVKVRALPQVMRRSAKINGLLAPLIAFSIVLQQLFSVLGVGDMVRDALLSLDHRYAVIGAMMVVILVSGAVLESLPNVVIWAPILAPIATTVGVDPVHFAAIFMVGIAIGFVTPPYGLNLFVVSGVTGLPYTTVSRQMIPYIVALVAAWVVVVLVPPLATFLPGLT